MNTSVTSLIVRAKSADPDAFARLVAPAVTPLLVLLRRGIATSSSADLDEDDLLQNVLARAWQGLPGFVGTHQGSFHRWLVSIAGSVLTERRRFLSAQKRGTARRLFSLSDGGEGALARHLTSLGEKAVRLERVLMIERALAALPATQREVVELHLIEGQSLSEIAGALGISKTSTWERLRRGLAAVRENVESPSTGTP